MRIVYVTSTLPTGPSETFIYPEVNELIRRRHDVLIVPLRPLGLVVHEAGRQLLHVSRVEALLSPRVLLGAALAIVSAPVRAVRALLLMLTQNPWHLAKNIASFPKALWLGRILRQWKADHIHAHWVATTASMAMAASEFSGVPWSFTAHRWDIVENNLINRKVAHAQFGRFIAEKGLETARSLASLPRDHGKLFVLHMGVPLEANDSSHDGATLVTRYRLLCPANLIPVKGHEYLLQAVAKLHAIDSLELWLAGDGELRTSLERQAKELRISHRVRFLGMLDHDELMGLYRDNQVDVVVLPSVEFDGGLHEGIPVALIEAMSYGIPVIGTSSGGTVELLKGGAGLMVPPRNVDALASAIKRLFEDQRLYAETGRRGLDRVRAEFEIGSVVDTLVQRFSCVNGSVGGQLDFQ